MSIINPPNTPVLDVRGNLRPEWYRFFIAMQADVAGGVVGTEEATIYGSGAGSGMMADLRGADDRAVLGAAPHVITLVPDFLPPLPIEPDPVDLSPYAVAGGASYLNVRSVTGNAVVAASDYTLLMDAFTTPVNVILPSVATSNKRILTIKKIDASANIVTITPTGGAQIDYAATLDITTFLQSFTIQCNGTNWWVI